MLLVSSSGSTNVPSDLLLIRLPTRQKDLALPTSIVTSVIIKSSFVEYSSHIYTYASFVRINEKQQGLVSVRVKKYGKLVDSKTLL